MNPAMSSRTIRAVSTRLFSSSSSTSAAEASSSTPPISKRVPTKRQNLKDYNVRNLQDFQFDDATSLGFLRLEKIREAQSLIRRVDNDRSALRSHSKPFKPPAQGSIRITQRIDLSEPNSLVHNKRVLVASVSSLPLGSSDAIQRFKLLAGPRWTPGFPGSGEAEADQQPKNDSEEGSESGVGREGKEGWVKLSEEKFPNGMLNRRSVSDTLERLVEAANDPQSPISPSTPLDPRHLLAKQHKSRNRSIERMSQKAAASKTSNLESIGGVKGFPKEWLMSQDGGGKI